MPWINIIVFQTGQCWTIFDENINAAILSINQDIAFSCVDGFLFYMLQAFGVGEVFLRWINFNNQAYCGVKVRGGG